MTYSLYQVGDSSYEWICYIFETTRNRAKARVAEYFDQDYVDMRCKTLKRGVNVDFPMIVDCPESKGYEIVQQFGYGYLTEDEWEASFSGEGHDKKRG